MHVGFVNASVVPPQLACLPLRDDAFMLCVPAAHPLASSAVAEVAQLSQERFVMFSRDVSPANYDNVIAIFSRAGIHPRIVHAARQWLTIVAMVAQGLGVAIVPRSLARSRLDGVCFVPLGGPPVTAPAVMVWNPAHATAIVECFLAEARQVIQR
nr:LysR substrate-binding domain-containing protein [Variovorax paradoxus]